MRSRLLFFSLPNSSHHGLDFSIPCLPYSISSLHGRESKQLRLPPSGFSISAESLFSRNPAAASIRLHLGRRLSSPSILGRRLSSSSSAYLNSSLKDAVVQQFKEPEGGGRQIVPMLLDRLFSPSVLKHEFSSQSSVDSRTKAVSDVRVLMAAEGWVLLSVAAVTGKRRWMPWAWASHVCWLARVSEWAVEASGPETLKIDYRPFGVMSIGYYYPFFN